MVDQYLVRSKGVGSIQRNLYWQELKCASVLVPPRDEQDQIVRYLDWQVSKINHLIHGYQKQINLLDERKTTVINQAVTRGIHADVEMQAVEANWVKEIPAHWQFNKVKQHFEIKKRIAGKEGYDVISITQQGLKVKDIASNEGQMAANYSKYQFVYPGDYAMNHMDLLTGFIGLSDFFGVTSPDYRVFSAIDVERTDLKYFLYVFQLGYKRKIFYGLGRGAANKGRWRMPAINFKNYDIPVPPIEEQREIVEYIEQETEKIDLLKKDVEKHIEYCPTVHWMKMGRNAPAKTPDNPYDWAPRTITGILEKQEYLGHMVNFKTRKQSYRSKKKLENPPDQWKIFENTHEAIIDEETFARVQELRKNKRRPARTGKTNMFSGLVRCADCGEKLYYCTSASFETRQDHFVCSTSRKKGKEVCDTHFIRAVVLEEGTLQHMRLVIQCVADYEDAFRKALGAKRSEEAKKELSAKKRTLQKSEKRLAELDRLFKRIYEDMVNRKLSEARFQMLSDDYEQEQADLRAKIEMLENEIQNQEDQAENVDRFIRQAKKYLYLEKLTPTILNDMVNAVYVHAPDKSSGHRVQDVTISYNYIGILPANLLYDVMNGKAA